MRVDKMLYECSDYHSYLFKTKRLYRIDGEYEPYVYVIKERTTGIKYIGCSTRYVKSKCLESDLGTKYFTSSDYVNWSSDEFEILEIISCASNHDAYILEELMIKECDAVYSESYYNKHHPKVGFNTSGHKQTSETKKKIGLIHKGKHISEEEREQRSKRIQGEKHHFYGKSLSDQHKQNIRKGKKGKSNGREGKTHSNETIEKISNSLKGNKHPLYGKGHSNQTKKKMSIIAKNRPTKTCPHCQRQFKPNTYARWHGDKCKNMKRGDSID